MRRSATRCLSGNHCGFRQPASGSHLQTVPTLAEALAAAKTEWVFIGGGAWLYAEAMPLAEMLYLTEIDGFFQGDVFFPPLPAGQFARIAEERHDGEIPYVYVTYRRNK
ncbi:MAG: dihydrofolate reductase [Ruminococcus callidus]